MKLSKKGWIGIVAGAALFLAAFGVAFGAVTLVQVSQTHEGVLSLTATVVISGDNIALWDTANRDPLTTPIQFTSFKTQAPLRNFGGITRPEVWIENLSEYNLRPIDPVGDFRIADTCCFHIHADLYDEFGDNRDSTHANEWPEDWVMAPGDMWRMSLYFCCWPQEIPSGDHSFDIVFGAIGGSGDALSASIRSISEAEALGRGEERGQEHLAR